jgi:hypothetical protein
VVFTFLLILRGTEKIPSMIGIERCSFMYWFMLLVSLGIIGFFGYRNYSILKGWQTIKDKELKNMNSCEEVLQNYGE